MQAKGEAARLARKRKSVDQSEQTWLQTHLKSGKDALASSAPGRGRIQAIADTIIGNLQFSITNVHIRYEARSPWPEESSSRRHTSFCDLPTWSRSYPHMGKTLCEAMQLHMAYHARPTALSTVWIRLTIRFPTG